MAFDYKPNDIRWKKADFTNPTTNPTLTLDTEGRALFEVWVKSIAASIVVKIYGSVDNSTWRELPDCQGTTNADFLFHDGFFNAYKHIKVEVVETGTGTITIEVSANAI